MIRRRIQKELQRHLAEPEISLIAGARQVGKTTLMNLLMEDLKKKGESVLFLSMDFEDDQRFFVSQEALIKRIRLEFGDRKGYVFLDEIQQKENAGRYLKGLYDMNLPWKMIISGSGSIELKESIAESLAGRKRIFEVAPVSFSEFLDFRTGYAYSEKLHEYIDLFPVKSMELLNEYLNFGGYPRVITARNLQDKILAINEIYQSYVDRDIRQMIRSDHPAAFSRLIRLLAAQTGQTINLSNLACESQLSVPTIRKHLWLAHKTYFIRLVEPYFNNITKEITKSPVVYFSDHGMRNFSISSFGNIQRPQDYGFAFQNLVGNTLLEGFSSTPFSVHFWRTTDKAEVDFIIARKNDPIGVEVKFSSFREPVITRSLRSFVDRYQPSEAWVVNLSYSGYLLIGPTRVRFIRFYNLPELIKEVVDSIEKVYMFEEQQFPYMVLGRGAGRKRK